MKNKQIVNLWLIIALAVVIECLIAGCASKLETQTEKPSASAPSGNVVKTANAQQYDPESDFEVTKLADGKSIEIKKYVGSKQTVSTPPRIQGLPVTSIGVDAFRDNINLTSVLISDSVTSIGESAFYSCNNLTSVTIPNSVTIIGNSAFTNTAWFREQPDGLVYAGKVAYKYKGTMPANTSITLLDGTKGIADEAFSTLKFTSINIPNSVTNIGVKAFWGCDRLRTINVDTNNANYSSDDGILYNKNKTTLIRYPQGKAGAFTIPNNVTSIGDWAFWGCESLNSVTIPNSVTSIGKKVFNVCRSLTSINVSADNREYTTVDGILYNKNRTTLVLYPSGKTDSTFVIPDSVTSIGESAFFDCFKLTSINIPDSVTSIGDSAFYNCQKLTSITIPNGVTTIGDYAFYYCNITSITIPSGVTSIENSSFSWCKRLRNINIPNGVTSIGDSAFYYCESLASITIPNSVTSIGDYAFKITNITNVTIPNSVTSIGKEAFADCSRLTSINVSVDNSEYTAVDGVLYNKDRTTLIIYPSGKRGSTFTIPNSVTTIKERALSECDNLTSINIPDSVTTIGELVFFGSDNLTSITVDANNPNFSSVDGILYNKEKTRFIEIPYIITGNVNIPNGITSIGRQFNNQENITGITIPNSVTSIEDSAFDNCSGLTAINVDANNTNYSSEQGVLYNKNKTTLIKYPSGKTGNTFTIPNSITTIGNKAFYNCQILTRITISNSVTRIGEWAFGGSTSLTSVTISTGVTSIEYGTFGGCTSLTSITIPNSITSIKRSAFWECTSLASVIIPDSVTSIGDSAFSWCKNLTSVTFQGTITSGNFSSDDSFYGDLRTKYLAGGIGTYKTTAPVGSKSVWTKQ